MSDSLKLTKEWFETAMPFPTAQQLNVQIGVHIEEFVEMLATLSGVDAETEGMLIEATIAAGLLAYKLKRKGGQIEITDRVEFLDSLADQITTATGCGHCARMDILGGMQEVVESNWSKFDDEGNAIFNEHGKIAKGPNYCRPDLAKFAEEQ